MSEKGVVHLLPLLLVLAVLAFVGLFLVSKGLIKNPLPEALRPLQRAEVKLQADYKNPLDTKSQYVNPFSDYKNPFDALK